MSLALTRVGSGMDLAALSCIQMGAETGGFPMTPSPIAPQDFCFGFLIAPLVNTQRKAQSLSLLPSDVALILDPLVTTQGLAP